ncbi:lantibiotic dehydratase [Saccharothrix sp. NRRL B-16314]|uniref:lantibiotic dehydratase n=1 Tax=Saccharothrix sp. NRRL B-16314 TaxID=1463825 RepID=UPI00052588C5|nr:lantibiotic dehydratase [Saccharothrix sp. NRRL B-16314]
MTGRWRMVPHFLVRGTGFPVELLERIALDETAAAVDRLLDGEDGLAALSGSLTELLAAEHGSGTAKVRRLWWKRVSAGRPIRAGEADLAAAGPAIRSAARAWDAALAGQDALWEAAQETFTAELAKCRAELRSIVSDERFAEAVWESSPPMLERGITPYVNGRGGASGQRRLERQLVAYLQRFCAKNDTASFFGPIGYGAVGTPSTGPGGNPGDVRHREAFIAFWAVAELAQAIGRDDAVRPHLVPVVRPVFRVDADRGTLEVPGRGSRRLPPPERDVLALVDGTRSVTSISYALNRTVGDILAVLDVLAGQGVVRLAPEPPVTDPHPITWLSDWVAGLPSNGWHAALEPFRTAEKDFPAASLPEKQDLLRGLEGRFEHLTGVAPRRGAGGFYVDRLLIYEEAASEFGPLVLSAQAAEAVRAQLAPILDVYAAHAVAVQQELRATAAERLSGLAPDGRVPLVRWIESAKDQPLIETTAAWQRAVAAQLQGKQDEREVELDPARLPRTSLDDEVLISSPDLLLLADDVEAVREGRFRIVVGECHDTALLWGWPLRFHPEPGKVRDDVARALRSAIGEQVVASVLPGRRVKITPFEYPGPTVELSAASTKPAVDRVPAHEVGTRVVDGRPVLHADRVGDFTLHNGELHTVAHRTFGLPRVVPPKGWELGGHTPRLRIGDVVVQRERWRVQAGDLFPGTYAGDDLRLVVDYRRAARRLGLPRYLFARVEGDRKPVHVDGHSWLLLQLLHHLAADKELVLTEMLPRPDQLWLSGSTGRFCSELRFTLYRTAKDTR